MKLVIKEYLYRSGLMPILDWIRRLPEIIRWTRNGCRGHAPPPIKRLIVRGYLKAYSLNQFIETGTFVGDTLAYVAADRRVMASSIELDEALYEAAVQRFGKYRNVNLFCGDSGVELPKLVNGLAGPALFWLDGHYSGGVTGQGQQDTPVSAELAAVLASPISGHVILIDDARCFDGTHDYPHLDQLLATIRQDGRYHYEVTVDIIRLTPK